MKLRLIDEDDVMEMLTNIELSCTCIPNIEAKIGLRDISTAYDVDKVVEQIKDKGKAVCCSVKCNDNCNDCEHGCLMNGILEIVKAGGVNDKKRIM